jgi:hypothetical protein
VVLVEMGLSTPASWRERHRAEPERLGADGLRAYPRRVVQSLLALVDLPPRTTPPSFFSLAELAMFSSFPTKTGRGLSLTDMMRWVSQARIVQMSDFVISFSKRAVPGSIHPSGSWPLPGHPEAMKMSRQKTIFTPVPSRGLLGRSARIHREFIVVSYYGGKTLFR